MEKRVVIWLLTNEGTAHRSATNLFPISPETWCGSTTAGYIVRRPDNRNYAGPKCKRCFKRGRPPLTESSPLA